MGMLSNAMQWLERKRQKYLTVPVQYQRGNESVSLPATIGKTVFAVPDSYGVFIKTESRDYLIRPSDLVFDGKQTLPVAGDRIIENVYVYEVMAPGNQPCWRWSDDFCNTLRIHTKLISNGENDNGSE